jgi:hypothetical protein
MKKTPAKRPAPRKPEPEVTPKQVETIEPGQLVRWSKADLLDPEEADDEDRFWPVPEGTWREVNNAYPDTLHGEPVLIIEYACSRYSGDDFDERTYRAGTVLPTQPPTFRTHTILSLVKVGDHLKLGDQEWIVHADWLEER